MRVTRQRAAAHREQILDAAGRLLRQRGLSGVGVAEIMNAAGLTHGGFYGHFASKDDLCAEMTRRVLASDDWPQALTGTATSSFEAVVRGYLSPRHRDDPGRGCLFAALGSDVARQPIPVRRAFTEGLRRRVETLRTLLPGRSPEARRRQALATMSGLVGALVLSRAVDDAALSREILDAAAASFGRRETRQ